MSNDLVCCTQCQPGLQNPLGDVLRAKESRKVGHSSRRNSCVGAGHPHVPKGEPAGKSGLAEQRPLAGTHGKKESGSPLKEEAGSFEGLQGCYRVMLGEN